MHLLSYFFVGLFYLGNWAGDIVGKIVILTTLRKLIWEIKASTREYRLRALFNLLFCLWFFFVCFSISDEGNKTLIL